MTTKATIQRYIETVQQKGDLQSLLAPDASFTSFTSPVRKLSGKQGFLQAVGRFYSTVVSVELRDLIVDGDRACALTHYQLQPPNGAPAFESDVAEIFTVADGMIDSLAIYFDTAPYPK